MLECLGIFLVALAGGCLPLLLRWNDRTLHLALSLSAGVFLGAVFLHLLPEMASLDFGVEAHAQALEPEATHSEEGGIHQHRGSSGVWVFVLVGLLAVYLIEALFFRAHDHHHDEVQKHRAVGYATLVGLSIHSLTDGMGLSAAVDHQEIARPLLLAVLCHKGFEAFSLTSVFQLGGFARARILTLVTFFSLVSPLGFFLGRFLAESLTERGVAIFTALTAGTFLYVSLCELLPEVFHHREDGVLKVGLLTSGIAAMAAMGGLR